MSGPSDGIATETYSVAALIAFVVVALWLPVGLGVRGTIEELLIREQFLAGMDVWEVGGHFLRPFAYVPFYLGYLLTPDSFVGLNLLHMGFIWGKGMALFLVLRKLGTTSGLAMATAAIFVLFPADDGQMTLRTVAIQGSVALFLLAVYLLLRLGQRWTVPTAIGLACSVASGLSIYEAALPLAMLAPLLLLLVPGQGRSTLAAAAVWYGTLGGLGGRYLATLVAGDESYQDQVMIAEGGLGWLAEAPLYLWKAYERTLFGGWLTALGDLVGGQRSDALLGLGVGLAVGLAVLWIARKQPPTPSRNGRVFVIGFVVVGLAVIALGFAMYLPTSIRTNTWRTLFLPSLGGALVVVGVVRGLVDLAGAGPRAFAGAVALVTAVGFVSLSSQHQSFAAVSSAQRQVVEGVVAAVPVLGPRAQLLLLFDETDRLMSHAVFPFSRYLRSALYPHYRRADLNVHICRPFVDSRGETCVFTDEGVTVAHQDVGYLASRLAWTVPYEALVALRQDRHGRISLLESLPPWYTFGDNPPEYDPRALIDDGAGFVSRGGRVFREFAGDGGVGAGWGIPRETTAGITYRFLPHSRGAVHAPLEVRDHRIEVRIANGMTPELLASVALSVGGERITLTDVEPALFRGRIPADLIAPEGETLLIFEQDEEVLAAIQEEKGPLVGLGFDWVRLEPIEGEKSVTP